MSTGSTSDTWISCTRPNPAARLRLFCLPYAGGGATVFTSWQRQLPAQVELCALKLPGREARMREPPFERLTPLVRAIATGITPWLTKPFVFYGHSLGALVSFELTRELRRRRAPLPRHLLISGRRPPHMSPGPEELHGASDQTLVAWLRRVGGTPDEVLREPELLAMVLRILRADIAVNETEPFVEEDPLDCPISAFGGLTDERASRAELEAWRQHTRGPLTVEMFPGGHFFLQSARDPFLRSLSAHLEDVLRGLPA